jgi:hypothetical protein
MEHEGVLHNAHLPSKLRNRIFKLIQVATSAGSTLEEPPKDYRSSETIIKKGIFASTPE